MSSPTTERKQSLVSAIIPSYNCSEFVGEAIASVLNQTYSNLEVVIVDDGSTDDTEQVVGSMATRNPGCITYIRQENAGQAVARNTGIRNSTGSLIAMLDADDKWYPKRLERQLAAFDSNRDLGLVYSNSMRITEAGGPAGPVLVGPTHLRSGQLFESLYLRRIHLPMSTVMFRRTCCDRVGLFDENPTALGCEDREYWLRISKAFEIGYLDEFLAYYRLRQVSHSKDYRKVLEGRLYVTDKHSPEKGRGRRLRQAAISRSYRDYGDKMLRRGDFSESKAAYWKAIKQKPSDLWPWVNLLKAAIHLRVKPHARAGVG